MWMRTLVTLATIGIAVFALANPVGAEPPTTALGTFSLVDLANRIITLERTADGNQIMSVRHETPLYSGGLNGIAVDDYALIVRADGSVTGQGTETCSACTIGGRTGDYTATFALRGTTAHVSGRLTFQSGSGGLAGLHGGGTFEGGVTGSYAYDFLFAP
jgi:hypothetical protein